MGHFQICFGLPGIGPITLSRRRSFIFLRLWPQVMSFLRISMGNMTTGLKFIMTMILKWTLGVYILRIALNYLRKFRIPSYAPDSTSIAPGGHLMLWTDGQPGQGVNHLGFKLKGEGEFLALMDASGIDIIDSVIFPNQYKHFSYSRENNSGDWKFFHQRPVQAIQHRLFQDCTLMSL